jgi:hypothetical protein
MRVQFEYEKRPWRYEVPNRPDMSEARGETWEVTAEVSAGAGASARPVVIGGRIAEVTYDPGYAAEVEIDRVVMYRPDSYTEIEIEDIGDRDLERLEAIAIEIAAERSAEDAIS